MFLFCLASQESKEFCSESKDEDGNESPSSSPAKQNGKMESVESKSGRSAKNKRNGEDSPELS